MNNMLKLIVLGSSMLALPMQAAVTKTTAQKQKSETTMERLKAAIPAIAKVAVYGTASSIALEYSLKNFKVLMGREGEAYSQIRKMCYHSLGPIVAAMVYELFAKEAPETEEYELVTTLKKKN